jgi:hypothetical protein
VRPAPAWVAGFAPAPLPLPPPDFAGRALPLHVVDGDTLLFRIHRAELGALFFGPAAGSPPLGRWDAPEGEFGVCYLGLEPYVAFAETFLRVPGILSVGEADLRGRALARVRCRRALRLAAFHGSGLARIGASSALCSGPHEASRIWSAALHAHPAEPDGVLYRARHDDDGFAAALFDRGADAVEVASSESLLDEEIITVTGSILDRYDLAID